MTIKKWGENIRKEVLKLEKEYFKMGKSHGLDDTEAEKYSKKWTKNAVESRTIKKEKVK